MTTPEEKKILTELIPVTMPVLNKFGKQIDFGNDFIRFEYMDETFELRIKKLKNGKNNKV